MIKRNQITTFLLLLLLLPFVTEAKPETSAKTTPDTKVKTSPRSEGQPGRFNILVSGNTRTKTSYIKNIVHECIKDHNLMGLTDAAAKTIKECVINSRHFSKAEVSIKDNQIQVNVTERWSLIPLPFVMSGREGETRFGLSVFESNLFGYGKTLAIGGAYSKYHTSYFASYYDPSIFFTDWNFGVNIARSNKEILLFEKEEEIDGLDETTETFRLSLGYKIMPKLTCAARYFYTDKEFNEFDSYSVPDDYHANSVGFNVRFNDSNFRFYFQEGIVAQLGFVEHMSKDDGIDQSYSVYSRMSWQKNLFCDHALQIRILGGYLEEANRQNALRIGRRNGFRGIQENGAWVEGYVAVAIDYQIPLWRTSFGTLTVAPFVDAGYLWQAVDEIGDDGYISSGLGCYYYLKRVAVPGIGIQLGSNSEYQDIFFQFSIGFLM